MSENIVARIAIRTNSEPTDDTLMKIDEVVGSHFGMDYYVDTTVEPVIDSEQYSTEFHLDAPFQSNTQVLQGFIDTVHDVDESISGVLAIQAESAWGDYSIHSSAKTSKECAAMMALAFANEISSRVMESFNNG